MISFVLSCICLLIFFGFRILKRFTQNQVDNRVLGRLSFIPLTLCVIFLAISSYASVEPGHRGIQTTLGSMRMEPLGEGPHWPINPLSSVTSYSIQNRIDSGSFECETSDTQTITVGVSYNWRPNPEKITFIAKNNGGKDFPNVIIPPAVKECVKAEIAQHKVSDITQKRHQVKMAIEAEVKVWLAKYDIELLEMSVSKIDFSEAYDHAIEQKQVEEQSALKSVNILNKTDTEAKIAASKAKGEADAKIAEAQGKAQSMILAAKAEAEALKIKGEAQAEYNKRVADSLTGELLQRMYIEQWNGILPQFMLGDTKTASIMIPMPNTLEKK